MRYIYQNTVQDDEGRLVANADCTVYLAGTSTLATIYTTESGSVDADSVVETDSSGAFVFWVDEDDYPHNQLFKIVVEYNSYTGETLDDIAIFPTSERTLITDSTVDQGDSSIIGTFAWHISDASGAEVTVIGKPGTLLISQNITQPQTMTLKAPQGCIFKDDGSNANLTINGYIEAGSYQIFDWGNGTGSISFGSVTPFTRPEWWGVDGAGSTESSSEMHQCISDSNGTEIVLGGSYLFSNLGGTEILMSGSYLFSNLGGTEIEVNVGRTPTFP